MLEAKNTAMNAREYATIESLRTDARYAAVTGTAHLFSAVFGGGKTNHDSIIGHKPVVGGRRFRENVCRDGSGHRHGGARFRCE
jgi:hypothetical protein